MNLAVDERVVQWCQQRGVVALYLHGSQTRRPSPRRDIDIAVLLAEPTGWEMGEILREEGKAVLGAAFGCGPERLDVRVLNGAPQTFQFRVVRDRGLLWEGDRASRVAFERRLLCEYLDFRFYQDQHYAAMRRRLEDGSFGRRPAICRTGSA